MIKHFCDTCGEEIRSKLHRMTISMGVTYKEFDLCDKCRQKILTAAERHAWEAPQSDEKPEEVKEVKEKVKEGQKQEAKKKRTVDYGKIMALKNAGWTGKQIAAEVHLSEAAVWAAIKKSKEEGITGEGYLDEEE